MLLILYCAGLQQLENVSQTNANKQAYVEYNSMYEEMYNLGVSDFIFSQPYSLVY